MLLLTLSHVLNCIRKVYERGYENGNEVHPHRIVLTSTLCTIVQYHVGVYLISSLYTIQETYEIALIRTTLYFGYTEGLKAFVMMAHCTAYGSRSMWHQLPGKHACIGHDCDYVAAIRFDEKSVKQQYCR